MKYMLVVTDTWDNANNLLQLLVNKLTATASEEVVYKQSRSFVSKSGEVVIKCDFSTLADEIRGCDFHKAIVHKDVSQYNKDLALSRLRGVGHEPLQVGYESLKSLVEDVSKFLGEVNE